MNALYFSRSIIPFQRNAEKEGLADRAYLYKHIGLYAYRADVLKEITSLPQSSLELAESLEQLRWLENGYTIKVGISEVETIGIDTPQDLARAEAFLKQQGGKERMTLDRTTPPPIRQLSEFSITRPDRRDDEEWDASEYHSCGNRGCCTFRSSDRRRTMESGTAVAGYVRQQDAA